MADSHKFILAGRLSSSEDRDDVIDKFTGRVFAHVAQAEPKDIARAIAAGHRAVPAGRDMPSFARAEALHRFKSSLEANRKPLVATLYRESGKTIKEANGEVDRAVTTCSLAAEEAIRLHGTFEPLDIAKRHVGLWSVSRRVPVGLCAFITPFNFPLNLVMHKIAPAIACGCPFILKPAPQTPVTALMIGKMLSDCDLPAGFFSVLPMRVEHAAPLIEDQRIMLLSFTGSARVGWELKAKAGAKRVVLELGGNAACIVDEDCDTSFAIERIVFGAFYQSGQSCISVQRVFVHESRYEQVRKELVRQAKRLTLGDPKRSDTSVGPLISDADADRVLEWIDEARAGGAKVLCGGQRPRRKARFNPFVEPTIVENVPRSSRLWREEVFGPVMTLEAYRDFADALDAVNDSRYGLQAGVFSNVFDHVIQAWESLDVGAVIINDVPSLRVDSMPYGGIKDSGLGREGVRNAIESMTESRLLVVNGKPRSR